MGRKISKEKLCQRWAWAGGMRGATVRGEEGVIILKGIKSSDLLLS